MIFMDLFFQLYFMLARLSKKGLSSESFSLEGLYTLSFSVNLKIHEQIPLIVHDRTKKRKEKYHTVLRHKRSEPNCK